MFSRFKSFRSSMIRSKWKFDIKFHMWNACMPVKFFFLNFLHSRIYNRLNGISRMDNDSHSGRLNKMKLRGNQKNKVNK